MKNCTLLLSTLFLTASACSSPRAAPIELPYCAIEHALNDAQDSSITPGSMPSDWWTLFEDDQLSAFILTSFERSPTLQTAQANISLAIANANIFRSTLFPYLLFGADVSREKLSETALIPFNTNPPGTGTSGHAATPIPAGIDGIPVYFTQYEGELNLSYDFDIWGKNRNTWRAAIGEVKSNMADWAFSRLQLGIALAQVYYRLQIDYRREEIAEELVNNQNKYAQMTQQRLQGNLNNVQTTHTSKTNIASAEQGLLKIQGDIAVNEYQLKAYLAGNFDEGIGNVEINKQPLPDIPIPQDLPVSLLAHRPDITAQLWLIESAGKQIEVAKAGFYPDFSIAALFGYQTLHLHELFKWPSVYYNIDPAVSLPLFDGGKLIANLRHSEVNYDLAIYKYNELIINAVRDVLTGLALLKNSEQQYREYQKRTEQQESILDLTRLRVENNLNSELDYLTTQQTLLLAMDDQAVALGEIIQSMLLLIKALGGGYECGGR